MTDKGDKIPDKMYISFSLDSRFQYSVSDTKHYDSDVEFTRTSIVDKQIQDAVQYKQYKRSSVDNYTWDGRICAKCGGNSIMPEYKKPWQGKEYLQHTCGICNYKWKVPTLKVES